MNRREMVTAGAVAAGSLWAKPGGAAEEGKTLVERLGFKRDDRLLMVHADDLGMCHSVNAASTRALTDGIVSSGSVMVPCPWFPEIATWAREHPDADLGLHLTLTSEWRHYRWRPVSPPDAVKSLIDPDGFLWRSVADVVKNAKPAEVETEIRAQIQRARQFGMKPTHVDSHMGTLFAHRAFFDAYVRVAREAGIMPMVPGPTPETLRAARELGLDYEALAKQLQAQGYVLLDRLSTSLTGDTLDRRKEAFREFVRTLQPGVTELIVHLSMDDPEIQHVTGSWRTRYHEFLLCTDPDIKAFLKEQKVQPIGYRQLSRLWDK